MINEETYVKQCLRAGVRGHLHDDVWWRSPFPFYAKPMFQFRELVPGSVRPSRIRAFLGYAHHVPEPHLGNRTMYFMILEGEDLSGFEIQRLRSKKRNQVRKGLRLCRVRRLEDVEGQLEAIRQIYISQARRHTEHHDLPDTPPDYYVVHADAWRKRELRLLNSAGREVWGAFIEGELRAFLVTSQVEGVRFIEKMKTHTDALGCCPADALYFTVLGYAAATGTCQRIVNPGFRGGGLEHFKKQFLFRRTPVPVYVSRPRLFRCAERVLAVTARARTQIRAMVRRGDRP